MFAFSLASLLRFIVPIFAVPKKSFGVHRVRAGFCLGVGRGGWQAMDKAIVRKRTSPEAMYRSTLF
jgi:hypothetical protein